MAYKWNQEGASLDTSNNLSVSGTITSTGGFVGNLVTPAATAEHGAGAIGTGTILAPQTRRWTENGIITTQIKVDITGLSITGTAQGAAIGLAGVDGCYIGRYVLATYGVIYKVEMACLVAATKGVGTAIEADIDLCYTTAANVKSGEDVDVDIITAGRDWAAGEMVQTILPGALTNGDYLYLAGGDTAGNACKYATGQFIITMYGHAALA